MIGLITEQLKPLSHWLVASAVCGNCKYFITCDDKFIKTIEKNRNRLIDVIKNIKLYNPIDFLRKEMDIDVIEWKK